MKAVCSQYVSSSHNFLLLFPQKIPSVVGLTTHRGWQIQVGANPFLCFSRALVL